ncbi:MAG: ABC transporter permease [Clostridiales bacterium]|nr:ABC transporter permease [Clostridiales bacterium]
MKSLVLRNLKVFFRDRASVFFSLLSVLIILALYVLFLGDVWTSNLPKVIGAKALTDSWIMAGLLAVMSVTTVMGAFGTMVDDRAHKIVKDFHASPIGKGRIAGGYVLSSFAVGAIMTLIALALSQAYIALRGGALLPVSKMVEVVGLILLSALSNTAMISLLISFFKSQNAFGTAASILGTLIGFLTGIYMPIGMLPEAVQWFIKIFPVSHAALLIRRVMTEAPLEKVFRGAPAAAAQGFREAMGIDFRFGGRILPGYVSVLILAGAALLFYALSILRFSRKGRS